MVADFEQTGGAAEGQECGILRAQEGCSTTARTGPEDGERG